MTDMCQQSHLDRSPETSQALPSAGSLGQDSVQCAMPRARPSMKSFSYVLSILKLCHAPTNSLTLCVLVASQELGADQKAEILKGLAAKVFGMSGIGQTS